MEQLSDEELLFLSNLMHMKKEEVKDKEGQKTSEDIEYALKNIWTQDNVDDKYTIGDMINDIDTNKLATEYADETFDGEISGAEWAAMLEKIKDNDNICNLKLVDLERDDKNALSVCLQDKDGNQYVVFRGTAAGEWPDNFEGGYLADTEQQLRALAFVERQSGDNITVVGHSKGGNKAKYVAIRSDKVDRCVSFDGQGFSQAFFVKYGPLIEKNKDKITCYALDYDFVNILLSDVYYEKTFVNGHGVDNFAQNHSPNSLFNKDWAFDERNQSDAMASLHNFINYIVNTGEPEEVAGLMDYLGNVLNLAMGKKPPYYEKSYSAEELRSYLLDPDNAEELGLLFAYIVRYEEGGNNITEVITDIVRGMDFGILGEIISNRIIDNYEVVDMITHGKTLDILLAAVEGGGGAISSFLAWLGVLSDEEAEAIAKALEVAKEKKTEIPLPGKKYYKEQEASDIIRDFSTDMRTTLLKQVKEVEDEAFWDFTKWDVWYRIEELCGNLDIAHYKNNITEYHRKVIDVNDTTEAQMKKIFDAIDELDDKYGAIFEKKAEEFAAITQEVRNIMA